MKFAQTVRSLLVKNNKTQSAFLIACGLSSNTFSHWDERGTVPSGDVLARIADYLGVSVDYLLGRSETPTVADEPLTEGEAMLIELFRKIPEEKKEYVLSIIKLSVENR